MEKIREGYKKWFVIDTGDYLKKKKTRQESMQEVDIVMCPKQRNKKRTEVNRVCGMSRPVKDAQCVCLGAIILD